MKKIIEIIVKFILAYLTTVAMAMVSGYGITGIEIILPCVFALAYVVYELAFRHIISLATGDDVNKKILKRDMFCSVPLGFVFSLSVTVGSHFDVWDEAITRMGVKDIFYVLILTIFFTSCILILFDFIDKNSKKRSGRKLDNPNGNGLADRYFKFVPLTLTLVICWLPYYLTMLPGNLGKDTFESIDMCLGRIPWTNHHPIFFTGLINLIIKITSFAGSVTLSMAVFTFLHMVVVGCTLSYLICFIKNRIVVKCMSDNTENRTYVVCGLTLIFFALHPIVAMFSIYISKDVLFSCATVMLTLKLFDILDEIKKGDLFLLGLWSLLVMLLRNNGLLMICVLAVVLLIVFRNDFKRMLPAVVAPIVVFIAYRALAYNILAIQPESFAESASIPLQQVGYVIAMNGDSIEGLTEEEIKVLDNIMPLEKVAEVYELGYTDSYKFDPEFNDTYFNENKSAFMRIWFRLLPHYFGSYVEAYLAQTAGYWHYGETNTVCTQGVWEDNEVNVSRVDVIEKVTGFSLYGIIEKLMLVMRKAPLLCILSSMAMQFYAILLFVSNSVRNNNNKYILVMIPELVLWISVMIAAPAFCLFRYTYPMFLLWPITVLFTIRNDL